MAKRKRKPADQYDFLALEVEDYAARVDSSISLEVRVPRHYDVDAKVYDFQSVIELEAVTLWPDERAGNHYFLTLYGGESHRRDFDLTLSQCQARNEDGSLSFRKVKGKLIPVYDVPSGIGVLEKIRGSRDWTGFAWVSPTIVSDMLKLLPHVKPLYLMIHERKIGRHYWMAGLTLQTTNPAEE